MAFSKIKEVELYNFMSFEHTRLVFDETNILNIKGYNDSGKSAILRAIMVCLADMFKRAQVKYIRYGCEYFRIVVTFTDGVSILRDKYLNGQSLYEMYKDGEVVYTTKQGSRLTRIEGVPETIQKYLGMCMTETGCLNYQTCSEKMLLVETSGSENYQELNTVLKSDEISRATELINSDRNQLNARVIEVQKEFEDKSVVLKSRSYVDRKIIDFLERKDKETEELVKRGNLIKSLNDDFLKLESLEEIPELSTLEVGRCKVLSSLVSSLEEVLSMPDIPEVEKVDSGRAKDIESLMVWCSKVEKLEDIPEVEVIDGKRLSILESALSSFEDMPKEELPEVKGVDLSSFSKLRVLKDLQSALGSLDEVRMDLHLISEAEKECQKNMKEVLLEAEKEGIAFEKCPNCGTYVECRVDRVS